MSKRVTTEHLNLYAYNNPSGVPTFLKDWSDNAQILDSEINTAKVNIANNTSDIADLQEQLEVLDPENIRDYKARLDAMENKMKTQSTLLNETIKHDNGQDAPIATNANKIANLESQVASINSDLSSIHVDITSANADISALEARVTALENRCTYIEGEITDLRNDFIGLADDMTDLTSQFDSVVQATANKQDKLIAGAGIQIVDNVISVIGNYNNGNYSLDNP